MTVGFDQRACGSVLTVTVTVPSMRICTGAQMATVNLQCGVEGLSPGVQSAGSKQMNVAPDEMAAPSERAASCSRGMARHHRSRQGAGRLGGVVIDVRIRRLRPRRSLMSPTTGLLGGPDNRAPCALFNCTRNRPSWGCLVSELGSTAVNGQWDLPGGGQ